ncbi:hypothetical protein LOZ53_001350 [Ophidiomyces ophidiicola]|nr:hypothetical protein LOZ55_004015 [Ophidiomyces ophidiicola]KAI1984646.1 hypothetical protein LOZ54_004469 [Ophidiomyces ophidiicola]KAI1995747.1 hypothetical protein LOZ53_001350 [Ophidiomyces ophidiicola]KAI1997088.1 hypothetical protein LOZ51_003251 [Ophidiomyces ophidiicola]
MRKQNLKAVQIGFGNTLHVSRITHNTPTPSRIAQLLRSRFEIIIFLTVPVDSSFLPPVIKGLNSHHGPNFSIKTDSKQLSKTKPFMRSSRNLLSNLKTLPVSKVRTSKRPTALSAQRQLHNMAFFPRLTAGDFTPLFHLLDDYDNHRASACRGNAMPSLRNFTPKFDVREVNDSYHLDGELPGINQKDIEIEFTDDHTLVVKGHSKREYTATNDTQSDNEAVSEDAASVKSSHQPTVEDEGAPSTPVEASAITKQHASSKSVTKKPGHKYWVSERSIGEFQRTFSFPTRVNQELVRANLKDGILHIIVPKAAAPTSKRIRID